MPRLHLLATSLLASACICQAAAQAPQVRPQDLQLNLSAAHLGKTAQEQAELKRQSKKQQPTLLAQTQNPCYALRVYGFTPQDLKLPHPQSSTETDCTPASSSHLKALQLPATVNVK